ncbi:MAG: ribonuclease P protein component [Ferruginibacter sp.]
MPGTTRYFLRKDSRLKSRKQIDELFAKGNSFSNYPFKVIWLPQNKQAALQAAFSVSSRHFKKATDRNRIKRLMRESYRLQKNKLETHLAETGKQLSVFILYVGKEMPAYDLVFEKTGIILKRLDKFVHEAA